MSQDTIEGTWYDGQSSQARAVRLHLAAPGVLRIGDVDGATVDWPLDEVTISPRLGSTPRILRRAGHGQIECADSPLLVDWGIAGGSRIQQFADWLERRRTAIAAAAVLTVLAVVGFVAFGLPWLAREAAERMPAAVERQASEQVAELLENLYLQPSRVPAVRRERLRTQFRALVAGEPRAQQMRLHIVGAPELGPNAFALPDGRIYVTDGLVELAGSDEELLAVLAHEAGHHVHRHGMRQALESSSVFLLAGLLVGDVSGSSLAVSIPAVLLSNGFSRGHEREADRYAFDLLQRRGRSPLDFARIMQKLSDQMPAGIDGGPVGYLSTHPPSPERVRAARQAAGEVASPDAAPDGL